MKEATPTKQQNRSNFHLARCVRDSLVDNDTDQHVLLALALRASIKTNWSAYPSYETLAQDTRLSKRTAIRSMARLEAEGYIQVRRRTKTSNLFVINYPRLEKEADDRNEAADKAKELQRLSIWDSKTGDGAPVDESAIDDSANDNTTDIASENFEYADADDEFGEDTSFMSLGGQ